VAKSATSVGRPFVIVSGWRFVKEGKVVDAADSVPIDFDVADVAVHEAADALGILALNPERTGVPAFSQAAADLAVQVRFGRVMDGGKQPPRHAEIVGGALDAVESVAGIIGQGQRVERRIARANEQGLVGRRILNGIGRDAEFIRIINVGVIGELIAMVIGVHMDGRIDLADVVAALGALGLRSRVVENRQKQGGENGNDRDDDQEFNQCKGAANRNFQEIEIYSSPRKGVGSWYCSIYHSFSLFYADASIASG